jgi:DNA mismatch endonuclease Vsr
MKHHEQVLNLLNTQIGNPAEVKDISDTAKKVAREWVNPVSGGKEDINGLVYGLVQSGKTGVLSVSGAIGADEGYRTIIILTSDNDALYAQTLTRVRQAFPGMDILAKIDFRDTVSFVQRIKSGTCCIVTTKNGSLLESLIENFQSGNVKGLSALIIDDEADQASLNTKAGSRSGGVSKINEKISKLRRFFDKNTYLQVTATPQALFLQESGHSFRPKFTILSHPGADYVGGNDFFGNKSDLVREFDIGEITALSPGAQPTPSMNIPTSLLRALDAFMIGATYKRIKEPDQNCAFLCHVSTLKADHSHIVDLLREYKTRLAIGLKKKQPAMLARLKKAYDDLATTHHGVKGTSFAKLIGDIEFFSPGIKGDGNAATELRLISVFKESGIKGWRRKFALFGKPDFVFPVERVALFVDGCFWHGCSIHGTIPKTNTAFWKTKIAKNSNRDKLVANRLRASGWTVLRLWQHELKDTGKVAQKVRRALVRTQQTRN